MSERNVFPADFTWGVAASSYQIEGAVREGGRGSSIWDHFSRAPGKVFRGHTGEVACDHYRRYAQDVALMKEIGVKAYRFSIAWPRVFPRGAGAANRAGLDFYSRLTDVLLEAGIEPWATLYHWDFPWELHLRGGWLNPDISDRFADYVSAVVDALSDRVSSWMTLNEPQVFIGMGYGSGVHAPGLKLSLEETLLASHHALLAHGKAVRTIRARAKKTPYVGWAPVGIAFYPASESAEDVAAARAATFFVSDPGAHSPQEVNQVTWNSAWWMDPVFKGAYPEEAWKRLEAFVPDLGPDDLSIISSPLDFLGCNHYHGEKVRSDGKGFWRTEEHYQGNPTTTMKWDVTPESIYWTAKFLHERYGMPLYFTENGLAATDMVSPDGFVHDQNRVEFIRAYLRNVGRAVGEGIPVKGYFAWSLLDNFEWEQGYSQRFGLVYVDYVDQKRTLKDSARFYRDVMRGSGAAL